MVLSAAISDERLAAGTRQSDARYVSTAIYGSRWAAEDIPRVELAQHEMPPNVAYKLIADELALVGRIGCMSS